MRLLSKYRLPEGSTLEIITEPKARLLTLVEPEGRLYLDKIPNLKTIYHYYQQRIIQIVRFIVARVNVDRVSVIRGALSAVGNLKFLKGRVFTNSFWPLEIIILRFMKTPYRFK